jgi:hypothetical protein
MTTDYRTFYYPYSILTTVTVANESASYLLTFQLLVAGIMLTCLSLIEQTPSTVSVKFLLGLKPAVIFQNLSNNLKLLLSIVCLAAFFPLWAQAMLHFENPVALLMLMVCAIVLKRMC